MIEVVWVRERLLGSAEDRRGLLRSCRDQVVIRWDQVGITPRSVQDWGDVAGISRGSLRTSSSCRGRRSPALTVELSKTGMRCRDRRWAVAAPRRVAVDVVELPGSLSDCRCSGCPPSSCRRRRWVAVSSSSCRRSSPSCRRRRRASRSSSSCHGALHSP